MKKHSSKLLTLAVLAAAPFMTISSYGVYGLNPGTVSAVAASEGGKLSTRLGTRIAKSQMALATAIQDNTAMIQEAIAINIQQEALAATQIGKADLNNRKLETAVNEKVEANKENVRVMLDHGVQTGQGYQVCRVYAESTQTNRAVGEASLKAVEKVVTLDNSPGRLANSEGEYRTKRAKVHAENFCSQAEYDQGMCSKVSELPGADSNAALLFESAPKDSLVGAAKDAVRQNILGRPHTAIPKEAGQTALGQAYLLSVNRATSLAAFPAYSLAYLQSMSEIREDLKDAEGNSISPQDMLFKNVARYYGTEQATEWQKQMLEQRPRGILVELAKMEGLGAYIDYQRGLSNQRVGGNLAAMTITSTLPLEDQMNEQRRRMTTRSASNLVGR
ncbi:hypothetical protein ACFBZI_11450 [Moraxella sp. ZJ142]|uniref:hypothetical protein n=1 Tax=Moraxella marmotae TaxID=3344520 RepID=UPI0035D4915D